MTHPTDGTRGIMHRGARRGDRDSIRDGANRIDAREQLRPRRRLDVFHSQPFGRTLQRCTLAQDVALFLQKSFAISGGQELGIDLGREDWRDARCRGETAVENMVVGEWPPCFSGSGRSISLGQVSKFHALYFEVTIHPQTGNDIKWRQWFLWTGTSATSS